MRLRFGFALLVVAACSAASTDGNSGDAGANGSSSSTSSSGGSSSSSSSSSGGSSSGGPDATPDVSDAGASDAGDARDAADAFDGYVPIVYAGNHLWSKLITEATYSWPRTNIAPGPNGAVFLSNNNVVPVDVGGGALSPTSYVARWDTNGQHVWSKSFATAWIDALVADTTGVYIAGTFTGVLDFGGGVPLTAVATGDRDTFLAKLDLAGNHVWSKRVMSGWLQSLHLATTAGDVVWVSGAAGALDLGAGPMLGGAFVARLDGATGAHKWTRKKGAYGPTDFGRPGVVVDGAGDIIVSGGFSHGMDWGNGNVAPFGGYDIYVLKFDAGGTLLWQRPFGGPRDEAGRGIAVNAAGELFVTGVSGNNLSLGNGVVASSTYPTGYSALTTFLAKLTPNGDAVWAKVFGTSGPDVISGSESIALDNAGNVAISGYSDSGLDFGGGPLPAAMGKRGTFLAKIDGNGNHLWSRGWPDRGAGSSFAGGLTVVKTDVDGNMLFSSPLRGVSMDMGGGPLAANDWGRIIAKLGP